MRTFRLVALLACVASALAYVIPRENGIGALGLLREEFCACAPYDYECRLDVEQKTENAFSDSEIEILSWEHPKEFRALTNSYRECGAPWKEPRAAPAEMPMAP